VRIIAGEMRGRTLYAPAGMETRPTQDKVRESLFNILRFDVANARVLDLFAGSGALALEAVSRGARSATAVDCARAAVACIRRNVEAARAQDRVRVLPMDYRRAIEHLAAQGETFDLVFLDPPYRMENTGEIAAQLHRRGLLSPDCLVVIEHGLGVTPALDAAFEKTDERTYGQTQILFARLAPPQEEAPEADSSRAD
jgi:16S rRNA (guanine966-N2)-methyltransferase